jgi:N utilization substance protein A
MSTGKRCPNAALPGSRFCGVPAHQALAGTEADTVAIQSPETATQEEVAELEPIGANDPTSDEPELIGEDGPPLEAAVVPVVDSTIPAPDQEARDEG